MTSLKAFPSNEDGSNFTENEFYIQNCDYLTMGPDSHRSFGWSGQKKDPLDLCTVWLWPGSKGSLDSPSEKPHSQRPSH